jgi:hypothetical protein
MKNVTHTIEDLLEILAGLKDQSKIKIESTDATIMHSIARQVFKGTSLTDRQFALMKEKLQTYRDQFVALEYDFDSAIESLRQPLRYIDRSKYIKIVDYPDDIPYEDNSNGKFIKVRFPFSKSLIMALDNVTKKDGDYYHTKGTHEHYYKLTERTVYDVVNNFKEKNFEIDSELLTIYQELKVLEDNKHEYIPGVYQGELKNLPNNAIECLHKQIPEGNLLGYYDRRHLFGLHYFENIEQELLKANPLTATIAKRNTSKVLVKPSKFDLNELISSLFDLNRFPLLVILGENGAGSYLADMHNCLREVVPANEMSVMFRLDNIRGEEFNQYVRDNNLNNLVAENTKVVYISNNKIPKPLIQSGWKPCTSLRFSSDFMRTPDKYIDGLDLKLEYVEETGYMSRYGFGKRYHIA